jgi:hypothetical protein
MCNGPQAFSPLKKTHLTLHKCFRMTSMVNMSLQDILTLVMLLLTSKIDQLLLANNTQPPAATSSSAFPMSSVPPSFYPAIAASHSSSPESQSPDSSGTQTNSRKRASPPVDSNTALKRQRNNVAAKKYRQKKIDRITELEMELKGVKDERDDLKIRLARQEAEASALRSMLRMKGE